VSGRAAGCRYWRSQPRQNCKGHRGTGKQGALYPPLPSRPGWQKECRGWLQACSFWFVLSYQRNSLGLQIAHDLLLVPVLTLSPPCPGNTFSRNSRPARKAHSPFAMIGFTAAQPCHALITRRCGKSLSKSSTGPEFARPAKTAHPQIESIPEQEHKGTMPSLSWTAFDKEYMRRRWFATESNSQGFHPRLPSSRTRG